MDKTIEYVVYAVLRKSSLYEHVTSTSLGVEYEEIKEMEGYIVTPLRERDGLGRMWVHEEIVDQNSRYSEEYGCKVLYIGKGRRILNPKEI
jgi:hypothetical protein